MLWVIVACVVCFGAGMATSFVILYSLFKLMTGQIKRMTPPKFGPGG